MSTGAPIAAADLTEAIRTVADRLDARHEQPMSVDDARGALYRLAMRADLDAIDTNIGGS